MEKIEFLIYAIIFGVIPSIVVLMFLTLNVVVFLFYFMFFVAFQAMIIFVLFYLCKTRIVWPLILAGIKGNGVLFVKSHFNRSIDIGYTTKPKTEVEWEVIDKATGKKKKVRTFIKQIYHNLRGTNIIVHFCPVTQALSVDLNKEDEKVDPDTIKTENINMNSGKHAQISTEELNIMLSHEYMQGARDEARHYPQKGPGLIETMMLVMIAVLLIAAMIQIYLIYNVSALVGKSVI